MRYSQGFKDKKIVHLIEPLLRHRVVPYLLLAILGYYIGKQVIVSPFLPLAFIVLIFSLLVFSYRPQWIAYLSFILIPFHWLMLYQGRYTAFKVILIGGILFALSLILLRKRRFVWDRVYAFLGGYLFILFLTTALNGILFDAQRYIFEANIFYYFVFTFLMVFFLKNERDVHLFVKLIFLAGISQAALALLQLTFGDVFNPEKYFDYRAHLNLENPVTGYNIVEGVLSPIGSFIRRGDLGLFLLLPFSLGISFMLSKKSIFSKKLILIAVVLSLAGILSSLSRTSIMMVPVALLIISILYKRYSLRRFVLLKTLFIGAFAIMTIYFVFPLVFELIRTRFYGFDFSSFTAEYTVSRYGFFLVALRVFWENPLLGVGAGNFSYNSPLYLSRYAGDLGLNYQDYIEAHNAYAELLAETGILGFFLWFLIFLFTFRYLLGALKLLNDMENSFHKSVIIGFIAFYICYLLTFFTGQSIIQSFPLLSVPIAIALLYKKFLQIGELSWYTKGKQYLKRNETLES